MSSYQSKTRPRPDNSTQHRWPQVVLLIAKASVVAVVAWFLWDTVHRAQNDLDAQAFSFRQLRPSWLLLGSVFYLLGMLPMWWYWHDVMLALGGAPHRFSSCRAFFLGHLGKYVPGKALVVVIRTSLVRGPNTSTSVAAIAVFIETLTMMAVGACMAGAIIMVEFAEELHFQLLALGLTLATGIPTLPPIFRFIVNRLQITKLSPELRPSLGGVTYRLLARGWILYAIGWSFFGASLWATLQACGAQVGGLGVQLARLTATSALAVVAGFLSLIPGGLGVREVILDRLLAPEFGTAHAIVATVLLRLAWLMTEVVVSTILYLCGSREPA